MKNSFFLILAIFVSGAFAQTSTQLETDCNFNNASACAILAERFDTGIVNKQAGRHPIDKARAIELFQKSCDLNEPLSCGKLSLMYENGYGVKKDIFKAFELVNKACNIGYASACAYAGVLLYDGYGTRQDKFKAAELYKKGCDGRSVIGCQNLAIMYLVGEAVRQNKSKAMELFGLACDLKEQKGCDAYAKLKNEGVR